MVGIDFSSIPASACEICSIRLFGKGTELTSERRLQRRRPKNYGTTGIPLGSTFRDCFDSVDACSGALGEGTPKKSDAPTQMGARRRHPVGLIVNDVAQNSTRLSKDR